MQVIDDLKVIYQLALKPIKGDSHKERLESFYSGQAELYDGFRRRLLPGRQELIDKIDFSPGQSWLDVGGGTGINLEFAGDRIRQLNRYSVLDLSSSLLDEAKKKAEKFNLENVDFFEADACEMEFVEKFDGVIFSYSLTMIPNWFSAIERAIECLKPGGKIAVVDFFVSRKYPELTVKHDWWTRNFWRLWFENDGVYLNPEHVPYIRSKFECIEFYQNKTKVPYLPLGKVPYYLFVGERLSAKS